MWKETMRAISAGEVTQRPFSVNHEPKGQREQNNDIRRLITSRHANNSINKQPVIDGRRIELTNDYCELYLQSYLRNKWSCRQEHAINNSFSFFFPINSYSAYAGLGARR